MFYICVAGKGGGVGGASDVAALDSRVESGKSCKVSGKMNTLNEKMDFLCSENFKLLSLI